jgi:streptomycin 6-kinase
MTLAPLPEDFRRRVVGAFGAAGAAWLQRLPSVLDDVTSRWGITLMDPFEDMAYNFVAPATRIDGTEVVLKVGVPERELLTETAALRAFDGCGAARLLDAAPELGALLLERLQPGQPVLGLRDDESATAVAIEVMRRLWRPAPRDAIFPLVQDWAGGLGRLRERFEGGTGPFPKRLIETAEGLFRELLRSMNETVLLHGDLHHWNILSAEREPWLAIDPKGVIGDPAYEVGAWLRNPFPEILTMARPREMIARRLDRLAVGLRFDRDRLRSWGVAQAVLSAWWSYEDGDEDWRAGLTCAELIMMAR